MRTRLVFALSLVPSILAAGDGSLTETAEQARTLFKKGRYSEAAALARQVFVQQHDGRAADEVRVLLCKAKTAGEDVGGSFAAYREPVKSYVPSSDFVQVPAKISGSQPQFKRSSGREGEVVVTAMIDEDGCVGDLKVTRGLTAYADQVVLDALRDWVFRPALALGRPVRIPNEWVVNVKFSRR